MRKTTFILSLRTRILCGCCNLWWRNIICEDGLWGWIASSEETLLSMTGDGDLEGNQDYLV